MRTVVTLVLLVGLVGLAIAALVLLRPSERRPATARRAGFWLVATTMTFAFVFGGGEAISDPGGWEAAVLVAAWAVPLGSLIALAHLRPQTARLTLTAALLLAVAYVVWDGVAPSSLRALQDAIGPVPAYLVMVLGTAMAFLGRNRSETAAAGGLMVALTVLVGGAGLVLDGMVAPSTTAVCAPVLLAGAFYLWAGWSDRASSRRTAAPRTNAPGAPSPAPRS